MTNQSTIDKLIEMRLTAMADAFRIQMDDPTMKEVPFEDRFGMLVDVEYSNRKNNRLKRLIRQAELEQPDASIAAIDYHSGRKLNKALINRLATCEYITEYRNIFITGATGSGKTYMACAFTLYMDSLCSHHAEIQYLYLIYTVYNVIILPFHSCKKKREPFTALFHIDFLIHLSYLTVWQPMSLNFFPKMGQSLVLHQMPSQLLSFAHILLQIPMQIHNSKHLSE